jgi:hypothetical protein
MHCQATNIGIPPNASMRLHAGGAFEAPFARWKSREIFSALRIFSVQVAPQAVRVPIFFLKKRLIAMEKRSLVRYAEARHVPIPFDSSLEVIEAPLPEPDLNAPVAELVPWKD